jgi:tRNA G46 methylase TrmB
VYLRTDFADYFTQMQRVFAANPAFAAFATPGELADLPTDFEREFTAQGRTTHRAAFRLRANFEPNAAALVSANPTLPLAPSAEVPTVGA